MGVAGRVADYAQIPALHEGRGMVAGRRINVQMGNQFPARAGTAACVKSSHPPLGPPAALVSAVESPPSPNRAEHVVDLRNGRKRNGQLGVGLLVVGLFGVFSKRQ